MLEQQCKYFVVDRMKHILNKLFYDMPRTFQTNKIFIYINENYFFLMLRTINFKVYCSFSKHNLLSL